MEKRGTVRALLSPFHEYGPLELEVGWPTWTFSILALKSHILETASIMGKPHDWSSGSEKYADGWFGTGEYPYRYFKEGFIIDT